MRIPLSWLQDYVDITLDPEPLAELITCAGMEVTAIEHVGLEGAPLVWGRDTVVLAHLLEVQPHPDADKLVLASVDCGADAPKTVVTGAPNLFPFLGQGDISAQGLMSPLVLEGGTYLNPYKDKKPTKLKGKALRGIYNDAMLCSPVELGLGDDHDGILLLNRDALGGEHVPGTPLQDVLGDTVLEVDIIPNIARCASIVGIAREVAALTEQSLRMPSFAVQMDGDSIEGKVQITSQKPGFNPRFVAMIIEGVEQKPSPFWMQHRLRLAGQRPINVVVDISNYVMLELGQPNHTFDYDFLRSRADSYAPEGPIHIITRLAEPGETLTTLDGAEHALDTEAILVTDPAGNLSLGGIMGGRNSEIQPETQNVLLEAAAWDFINIRATSRKLALHTDAGFRFSRGVHPSQALLGAKRAAELLRLHAGGTVLQGIVDAYPEPAPEVIVMLDPDDIRRVSGLDLSDADIAAYLERLEFKVRSGEGRLAVTVPDHRLDVEGPHDLLEEVCRMAGYDRIPMTLLADSLPRQVGNPSLEAEEAVKDRLVDLGFREVITYRLTTPEAEALALVDATDDAPYLEIINPSTQDRRALRHALLPSVLEIANANTRFVDRIAIFEVGTVFHKRNGEPLPEERTELALVLTGHRQTPHFTVDTPPTLDFYDVKGVVEALADALHAELSFAPGSHPTFRPGRTASLLVGDTEVGYVGELHPLVVERYGMRVGKDQPVLAATLELDAFLAARAARFVVTPVPVYPAIREDVALVVDAGLSAQAVEEALYAAGAPLVEHVELFDLYTGENIEEGKKSLAYHLTFRSRSKTLKDKQVSKIRNKIIKTLERQLGATLRA